MQAHARRKKERETETESVCVCVSVKEWCGVMANGLDINVTVTLFKLQPHSEVYFWNNDLGKVLKTHYFPAVC